VRASVSGFDVRAAQAEHVRQSAPEDAHRRRDPACERRIRELGQRTRERLDLDEVGASRTDAFEVLLDAPDVCNQKQDALAVHSARS
jgi:hypothetical protein